MAFSFQADEAPAHPPPSRSARGGSPLPDERTLRAATSVVAVAAVVQPPPARSDVFIPCVSVYV